MSDKLRDRIKQQQHPVSRGNIIPSPNDKANVNDSVLRRDNISESDIKVAIEYINQKASQRPTKTLEASTTPQNVYIENPIVDEVQLHLQDAKLLGEKLTKKDIYNTALRFYFKLLYGKDL